MARMGHKVRIKLNGLGRGVVEIDDRQMVSTFLRLESDVGDMPRLTLTLLVSDAEVEVVEPDVKVQP